MLFSVHLYFHYLLYTSKYDFVIVKLQLINIHTFTIMKLNVKIIALEDLKI